MGTALAVCAYGCTSHCSPAVQPCMCFPHHHFTLSRLIALPCKMAVVSPRRILPSLLYLLEKYGLVFLLSTCVRGTDSSVKKRYLSIKMENPTVCRHGSQTFSSLIRGGITQIPRRNA